MTPEAASPATDIRYLDPVALVAWLAQVSDRLGVCSPADHSLIEMLRGAATREAEQHPARMVEARTLRRSVPTPQPCGSADFPLTRNTLPDVEPR